MRKINIGNWGMLLGCVGVLGLGTCSGHAYHEGILWHHWLGKDGKGRAIPDAYKALAEWQKRYEEREKNGTLSDEDKGKKLKFLWEAGGVVENIGGDSRKIFARGAFRVPRSGKYRKEFKLLSSSCLVVGSFYDGEFDAFPVTKDVKNAVKRALRVVTSEAFLSRILGADFFDEFVRRGSLPGECGIDIGCLFRGTALKEFGMLCPKAALELNPSVVLELSIRQYHRGELLKVLVGCREKIDDFSCELRLTWNMVKDEIEKVEVCDKFVVNKPIACFRKGYTIFEKK